MAVDLEQVVIPAYCERISHLIGLRGDHRSCVDRRFSVEVLLHRYGAVRFDQQRKVAVVQQNLTFGSPLETEGDIRLDESSPISLTGV